MPDSSPLAQGAPPKFVGKYRIVRIIAWSNDIVYEAIDPHLGRHVALKEMVMGANVSGAARRERIERFHREAKAAGALKHPNIVTIYEIGQHLEHRFIAMEYLEGQTVRDRLTVGGPLPIREAVQVALQLCDALGYAHAQGVVHRDVKPDNIHLIPPGATVKLTDFGIARVLTEPAITSAGQVFGTPSYMSPEQLTSRQVDHRSDIFSTAVVLYELITGKKPFKGDSLVTVTCRIMYDEPDMASIPPPIATILVHALMKDPDLRYQNMRTFAADLRTAQAVIDNPNPGKIDAEPPRSEPTIVMAPISANIASLDGEEPPTSLISATNGQPTVSRTNTATNGAGSETTSANWSPSSIVSAMDNDERLKAAILKLGINIALLAIVLGMTLWGVSLFVIRMHNNIRHYRALGPYEDGITAASNGSYAQAIASYRQAMQFTTNQDTIYSRSRRGISDCLTAQGVQQQSADNLAAAEQSYRSAISADMSSAMPHYNLGVLYMQRGDATNYTIASRAAEAQSLSEYMTAHMLDPASPEGTEALKQALTGYLSLGDADRSQGNLLLAREDWQQVVNLDSGSAQAQQANARLSQPGA